jgi:ferric-dicitrate binding protein FerR (iron transport regulator)
MRMADNSYVNILLEKYIIGSISSCEKQKLFEMITYNETEEEIKEFILSQLINFEIDHNISGQIESDKIFNRILSEIRSGEESKNFTYKSVPSGIRMKKIIFRSISIAAILAITFISGVFYALTRESGISVAVPEVTYSEIKAPFGSQSEVTLPDGSNVLLNAGSTLKYRNDFNTTNRDLSLHGEAYFKVARNPELPFFVKAGNINIMAVGTEFNIKAYDDEELIETTLVEGKVKITMEDTNDPKNNFIDLNPNQKAIYIKETKSFSLDKVDATDPAEPVPTKTIYDNMLISPKVDVNQVAAWTEGKLVIRGDALESLCMKLQRKYDVTFIFKDEGIKKYRFSGILLDETLEQVLSAIKLTAPIEYSISGKNVYLNSDKDEWNDFSKHMN